jgi:hypothetical protein
MGTAGISLCTGCIKKTRIWAIFWSYFGSLPPLNKITPIWVIFRVFEDNSGRQKHKKIAQIPVFMHLVDAVKIRIFRVLLVGVLAVVNQDIQEFILKFLICCRGYDCKCYCLSEDCIKDNWGELSQKNFFKIFRQT